MIAVLAESGYHKTMKEPADLYALLRFYANRTRSPSFAPEVFINFLEKYAKRYAAERPDLAAWAEDTSAKVLAAINNLVDLGRCSWVDEAGGRRLAISQFYVDLLNQTYRRIEETPAIPYPDLSSLRVNLPNDRLRTISLEENLVEFLEEAEAEADQIIKLSFPDSLGSIIVLADMIPRKLLELSFRKISLYLKSHNNKDYALHKLAPAFQAKESLLKDRITSLAGRPLEALDDLTQAGEFTYTFWAYFANLVKNDLKKKLDRLAEDTALLQSLLFIEFFNNYYKGLKQRARTIESALQALAAALDKPPHHFTKEDILGFTDSKGVPLLGQYSREDLENYLRDNTTAGDLEALPPLLIVHGSDAERWFIKKNHLLPLAAKLIGEARPRVKSALMQRWTSLLKDFDKDLSMADNEVFEKELAELTRRLAPKLAALLQENSLFLVHREMDGKVALADNVRLFNRGSLVPYSELYLLSRKDLLIDVKMMLPFWYNIPLLVWLASFFRGLKGRKPRQTSSPKASERSKRNGEIVTDQQQQLETPTSPGVSSKLAVSKKPDKRSELKMAARSLQNVLIPKNREITEYLDLLCDDWNRIINPKAKANLTEDVNSLIRDYLRRTIRSLRASTFTAERLRSLAETLSEAPAMQQLPARDALISYIQLYMVQLILKS